MGVGVRNGNYRLRTIWTPEMDRYFINLMLEEVSKGNRIDDHLFSKRAWKHMTTLFNAKFNSKYEKDVLKNRHKMLRNLYRTLKNLLEQKGFKWDESRQMVTADNKDWDDYIQAHPDARPYRVKSIPYYYDLCEIYKTRGNDTISKQKAFCNGTMSRSDLGVDDEKPCCDLLEYSTNFGEDKTAPGCVSDVAIESLHDIMIDEDNDILLAKGVVDETYEFLSDIGSIIGARTRTYWQPPMDRYFIDLMIDQVNKGNQFDGLLRKQAWKEMIASFNSKFGFDYEVDILKNRYKTLRKQYNIIKNLLELDGFSWDGARQVVIADDCVWQDYIKAHTDARQYMTRPVPYFEDLCLIFRELNGDEKDITSSHQNPETLDEDPEIKFVPVNRSPAASNSSYDQCYKEKESCSHSDFNVNPTSKCQLEIPSLVGSSKKSRSEDEGVVVQMATKVSSLINKRKEDENLNVVPIERVIAAIQELPDMDEELVLDACDLLEDEKKAKTFLALDGKLRKKWLLRKLRPQ
ncbi:hypothetical protein BUALT_Bualt02G0239000 [Buddleja alternifolia]|uniref:L10-interacting MYB domain-containing protein n=1 Tax=Buddleja alternifolia TaxID=168488 RepID=A0AAV6Y2V9_9LAMI|nr:hypothetical protein BUALT_Bualt02G0239000 [Buddleja alternifolia]